MKKSNNSKIKELDGKVFYLIIILLSIYLLIRLIDQFKIITDFPFDFVNDISSHMAKVYFLDNFGFRSIVPYWYNGYDLFKFYPPGWFFFALPLYKIFNNIQLATYISIILIYIIAVLSFLFLGRILKISRKKSIFFFLIFLANPIAIGNFLRVGRLPEFLAWTFFIIFFAIILTYKSKKIDKKFFLISIIASLVLLSHQTVFMLASTLLLSLLIIKKNSKERIYIILASILIILITSFWIIPFALDYKETSISTEKYNYSQNYFNFTEKLLLENIASIIITIAFLLLAFINIKNEKNKNNLYFFLPQIIIAILILTSLVSYIPILKKIHPDAYNTLFIFLSAFLLLKTKYSLNQRKLFTVSLNLIVIAGIILSIIHTPWYRKNTETDKNTISLFKHVKGKFFIVESYESYGKAYYSYAPIYYQLSTPSGWSQHEIRQDYLDKLRAIGQNFQDNNCEKFKNLLLEVNTTEVITYNEACKKLEFCGLKNKATVGNACLYEIINQ